MEAISNIENVIDIIYEDNEVSFALSNSDKYNLFPHWYELCVLKLGLDKEGFTNDGMHYSVILSHMDSDELINFFCKS